MASGLGDAAARPPRRFDLTMSRRTRRPTSLATNCHQEDPAQQQLQEECEASDNSRRFSLQELIQDEAVDGVNDDVAMGSPLNREESNAADATAAVQIEGEAAAAAEKRRPEQVAGSRRVIRMVVRRYAKVRSIKPKPAPEKNLAPVRMLRMLNN